MEKGFDPIGLEKIKVSDWLKEDKDNIQLGFRSKGQTIYVGSFLNFDEKEELKEEVSKIISELNSL